MERFEQQGNFGVTDGTRTHDDWNHNPGLYQLSYGHRRDQQHDLLAEQKQDYSDVFISLPSTFFTSSKCFLTRVRDRCATSPSHAANDPRATRCNITRATTPLKPKLHHPRLRAPRRRLRAVAPALARTHQCRPSIAWGPTALDANRARPAPRDTTPTRDA